MKDFRPVTSPLRTSAGIEEQSQYTHFKNYLTPQRTASGPYTKFTTDHSLTGKLTTHLQSLKFASPFPFPSLSARKLFQQLVQFFLPLKGKRTHPRCRHTVFLMPEVASPMKALTTPSGGNKLWEESSAPRRHQPTFVGKAGTHAKNSSVSLEEFQFSSKQTQQKDHPKGIQAHSAPVSGFFLLSARPDAPVVTAFKQRYTDR